MNSTPVVAAILLALMQIFSTAFVVWLAFYHLSYTLRMEQREQELLKQAAARYREHLRQDGLDPDKH